MQQNILIIGAGFAGMWSALSAVRLLDQHGRTDVRVTLLAPQAELRIRPRFYEPDAQSLYAPLAGLFEAVDVQFVPGLALYLDTVGRQVTYRNNAGEEARLGYDRLILATGSKLFRPPVPGLQEHAFDVDEIEQAAHLEQHLVSLAAQPASDARNTVVVIGGGFTGIETATEMPARCVRCSARRRRCAW